MRASEDSKGAGHVPSHVGFIMDGNRRWARRRLLPSHAGHAAGAKAVRRVVEACADAGVRYVTLFAFSTENWHRPAQEVLWLMRLFERYLRSEAEAMNRAGVRLRVLGEREGFSPLIQGLIEQAERLTAANDRIDLMVAANYGGRWDVLQAVKRWQKEHPHETVEALTESVLEGYLATGDAPPVDLLVRTGGEYRTSNFLLWQSAYAELYFTDCLWPDFGPKEVQRALAWYGTRERRFGADAGTIEQSSVAR